MTSPGELFEKLAIANIKLYMVCEQKTKAEFMTKEELTANAKQDIALCRERGRLKGQINDLFAGSQGAEVKRYGSDGGTA